MSLLSATARIANLLLPPTLVGVTTHLLSKNERPSKVVSIDCAIADATTGYEFLATFISNKAWRQLSTCQLMMVGICFGGGVACTAAMAHFFDQPENLYTAGYNGTMAALCFKIANQITAQKVYRGERNVDIELHNRLV